MSLLAQTHKVGMHSQVVKIFVHKLSQCRNEVQHDAVSTIGFVIYAYVFLRRNNTTTTCVQMHVPIFRRIYHLHFNNYS